MYLYMYIYIYTPWMGMVVADLQPSTSSQARAASASEFCTTLFLVPRFYWHRIRFISPLPQNFNFIAGSARARSAGGMPAFLEALDW